MRNSRHHDIDFERKRGLYQPAKGDFPLRYGESWQLTTPDLIIELDKEGWLKYLRGRSPDWPHPLEYLKRTDGNDWVYYSLGEYSDHVGIYGEHYLPCPDYPTNRPLGGEPFRRAAVREAVRAWPNAIRAFLDRRGDEIKLPRRLADNRPSSLTERARQLHLILGSTVPVLPPDARHIDYDVVPLIVSDGCRYGCRFCRVDDGFELRHRTRGQIDEQITGLSRWLGAQAGNQQGLFLGLHDALAADGDLLEWTIERCYRGLGFEGSPFSRPQLYVFGSVDSFLEKSEQFFEWLNGIPWSSFVNIGLESSDAATLKKLGKPLSVSKVAAAFARMVDINARFHNVEITANFLLLPTDYKNADDAVIDLMNVHLSRRTSRGVCYLSPLMVGDRRPRTKRRSLLERVHRLQRAAPLALYLYLIQRI